VVEGVGLENRYTDNGIVGSNPTLSARAKAFYAGQTEDPDVRLAAHSNREDRSTVELPPAHKASGRVFTRKRYKSDVHDPNFMSCSMDFLHTILEQKRRGVEARKKRILRSQLEDMPRYGYSRRSLVRAIESTQPAFVGEIIRRSPNGVEFDPLHCVRACRQAGAVAFSVAIDEQFSGGKPEYLEQIRDHDEKPVLRRDAIVDAFELFESRVYGADGITLNAAVLEAGFLNHLCAEAREIGLEAFVEVHNEDEIDLVDFAIASGIILNNKDHTSFETDITTSFRLKKYIPRQIPVISEGGITSVRDVEQLVRHGINIMLVDWDVLSSSEWTEAWKTTTVTS
jgi:indole-3-glycerol phosphate synthase